MSMPVSFRSAPVFNSANIGNAADPLSVQEMESAVASIDATQIEGIAISLIGDVMDLLHIDRTPTNSSRSMIQGDSLEAGIVAMVTSVKINEPSSIMEILLPVCVQRITESFSTPSEFVENGIVFDLLNVINNGLLDQLDDETLQNQISDGMRGKSTYFAILKVAVGSVLQLKIEHYQDEEWVAIHTAPAAELAKSAIAHVI